MAILGAMIAVSFLCLGDDEKLCILVQRLEEQLGSQRN